MPRVALLLLLAVVAAGGCGRLGRSPAPGPTASPVPVGPRIAVVDLDAVARVHPRWPEIDALAKQLQEVEAALSVPPQVPPVQQARLQAQLEAQGRRLEAEFQAEMQALSARQQQQLERYAAQVRAEQQAKLERVTAEIDAEMSNAMAARFQTMRGELRKYEVQVMDEYRFPLANIRLKLDVVGVGSEEELRRLSAEADRLVSERDARLQARAEVIDVSLEDFRKAKEAEANARLDRARREAEAEVKRRLAAKEQELRAESERIGKTRHREFARRLEAFRRRLIRIGQGQLDAAQRKYAEGLREREQQLLTQRQALQEQRARLEDAILADVKIEVAALAAARGYDAVLTRFLANVAGENITADVLARLKR